MKLPYKEILLLGGLYGIAELSLAYFPHTVFDIIHNLLFILFIWFLYQLCRNKIPGFILYIAKKYPVLSVYLTASGWIPFLVIPAELLFMLGLFLLPLDARQTDMYVNTLISGTNLAIPVLILLSWGWAAGRRHCQCACRAADTKRSKSASKY